MLESELLIKGASVVKKIVIILCFIWINTAVAGMAPLHLPAHLKPKGGILLISSQNDHNPDFLKALAKALTTGHWECSWVQVNGGTKPDFATAIKNWSAAAKQQQVLVAYGQGLPLVVEAIKKAPKQYKAAIFISGMLTKPESIKSTNTEIEKFTLNLLDITAQHDYEMVEQQLQQRKKRLKDKEYKTAVILGADHQYTSFSNIVARRILAYLHAQFLKS